MNKKTKQTEKATTNAFLDLNLSDIVYDYAGVIAFEAPKEEENILSINAGVFAAFCWVVTYVVKSLLENICNYLVEDPTRYDIVAPPKQEKLIGAYSLKWILWSGC